MADYPPLQMIRITPGWYQVSVDGTKNHDSIVGAIFKLEEKRLSWKAVFYPQSYTAYLNPNNQKDDSIQKAVRYSTRTECLWWIEKKFAESKKESPL